MFPAAVEDVKCAVRWMRANAKNYRVDTDLIAAVGGSAGAHLAAILGTTDASIDLEGDGGYTEYSSKVNAVVAFNGVFDMIAMIILQLQATLTIHLNALKCGFKIALKHSAFKATGK